MPAWVMWPQGTPPSALSQIPANLDDSRWRGLGAGPDSGFGFVFPPEFGFGTRLAKNSPLDATRQNHRILAWCLQQQASQGKWNLRDTCDPLNSIDCKYLRRNGVNTSRFWIEKARRKRPKKCAFLIARSYGPGLKPRLQLIENGFYLNFGVSYAPSQTRTLI